MTGRSDPATVPRFLYGTAWKDEDTARCVRDALEADFRGIDTANQRMHYHEAGVGEALRAAYADGLCERADLFLQTKFTPRHGQDHRLPYDPDSPLATQVERSFESSLKHLGTDRLDSYVLHGTSGVAGLVREDREIWRAMGRLQEQGRVDHLGVSNVGLEQLRAFCEETEFLPSFVQNRCFATASWDKDVREYCREHGLTYQGFSLLTANTRILRDPRFREIVHRVGRTPAQIVFRFALDVGILPLTGTTDPKHMEEDLAVFEFELDERDVVEIERIGVA